MSKNHTPHEWLERFYHHILMHTEIGEKAKVYLKNRGISKEVMREFKLGYSPYKIKSTLGFLKGKGFSFNDLVSQKVLIRYKSGKYKGKLSDPFRGRIVFPIKNFNGNTVAFGGRSLDDNHKIKYINSAESNDYVKSDNLYGFSRSKQNIKKEGYAILLEGYFDLITSHQNGINNTVATLGTALTVNQALLLKNVTDNVVVVFDGDDPGRESSFRSASILEMIGCNVRVGHMTNKYDPDDFIKKFGRDKFLKEVISPAKLLHDSFIEYKKEMHDLTNPNGRYSFAKDVLSELSTDNIKDLKSVLLGLRKALNMPLDMMYETIKRK